MKIGVVSDTHGFFDPRLPEHLQGVDMLLHAGDVGSSEVLDQLENIAPLFAVRGNNDERLGGLGLPASRDVDAGGLRIHLVHEIAKASPPAEACIVVSGHSHRPLVEERDGRLYVNPGAAGRVGFHRLQTAALITIDGAAVSAEIVELGPRIRKARR